MSLKPLSVAPIRRPSNGSYTAIRKWNHYADHGLDPICRSVTADLQEHFWSTTSQVIANSFGAYLFLHAQASLPPFPGRVLLLSPIVGEFDHADQSVHFSPPQPNRLRDLVAKGQLPRPADAQIHVGSEDWQSIPANVQVLGNALGIPVHIAPGRGHMLGEDYVGPLLDRWLNCSSATPGW
jgi:hypothetical protein